jgi:hypothetical protein
MWISSQPGWIATRPARVPALVVGWLIASAALASAQPQADLSTTMQNSPDSQQIFEPITLTVTVTNHGPDTATGAVASINPNAERLSFSTSQGECVPFYYSSLSCDFGDLAPGLSVVVTIVMRQIRPYQEVWSNAKTSSSVTDPNDENDHADATTAIRLLGGMDAWLSLSAAPTQGPRFDWWEGNIEEIDYMVRVTDSANEIIYAAPPWRSGWTDLSPVPETINCYAAFPANGSDVLGRSDLLCYLPESRSLANVPGEVEIRLWQSQTATVLFYDPPPGTTAFAVRAYPMDGGPHRTYFVGPAATSIGDDTGGVATCYVVFVLGEQYAIVGNADALCAVPGYSTFVPPPPPATASKGAAGKGTRPTSGLDEVAARIRADIAQLYRLR